MTGAEIAGSGRRRWTAAQKLQIVKESLAAEASVAELARRHNLNANVIYRWRWQAKTGSLAAVYDDRSHFALVAVAGGASAALAKGNNQYVASAIEVVLRNGRVLRVSECATPSRVAPLADALEESRS